MRLHCFIAFLAPDMLSHVVFLDSSSEQEEPCLVSVAFTSDFPHSAPPATVEGSKCDPTQRTAPAS